jgi:hypothetical protein
MIQVNYSVKLLLKMIDTKTNINFQYILGKKSLQFYGTISIYSKPQLVQASVQDPSEHFLNLLKYYLIKNKISIRNAMIGNCKDLHNNWEELFIIYSDPLINMMNYTLQ